MANAIEFVVKGIDQFTGTFNEVGRSLGKVESQAKRFAQRAGDLGKTMTTRVTLPIAGIGAAIIKSAGDFEQSMNTVRAISQASGDEFEALRDQAKELGSTTKFSASKAADGMTALARAGFDTNQILESMPGILDLAAASQISLEEAASRVTNVMSGYGKESSDVVAISDKLVAAANSGDTTVRELSEGLAEAGSIANSAGQDFDITVAALTTFNDVGIKGSKAGTSLRNALTRLLNPTKEVEDGLRQMGVTAQDLTDSDGRLLQLDEIVEKLGPNAENTGALIKAFGQEAGPAMAALLGQGVDALRETEGAIRGSVGEASRVAAEQSEGFNGAMRSMKSAIEGLAIAIADSGFLDLMTSMIEKFTSAIRWITELDPEIIKIGSVIAATLGAGGPVLVAISVMSKAFTAIIAATGPIGLFIAAATAIITAWQLWGDDIKVIVGQAVQFTAEKFTELKERVTEIWASIKDIPGNAMESMKEGVKGTLSSMKESITGTMGGIKDSIIGAFSDAENEVVGNSIVPDMVNASLRWFDFWGNGSIRKVRLMRQIVTGEVRKMQAENVEAVQQGTNAMATSMGQAFNNMVFESMTFSEIMKQTFKDLVSSIIAEMAKLAANRIFSKLLSTVFGAGGTAFAGPIGGVIGSAIGGFVGGLFHGGISNVPREGLSVLAGGERVLSRDQNEDLTQFLEGGSGSGSTIENATFIFNVQNGDNLLNMSREDWRELAARKIIPAFNDLDRSGVRQVSIERTGR